MRSKITRIIISETSDEIKSFAKQYANKIMDDKLKKEYLHRIMKARLIEDQITLLEQFGDEYAQSRQAAVSGSVCEQHQCEKLCPQCENDTFPM